MGKSLKDGSMKNVLFLMVLFNFFLFSCATATKEKIPDTKEKVSPVLKYQYFPSSWPYHKDIEYYDKELKAIYDLIDEKPIWGKKENVLRAITNNNEIFILKWNLDEWGMIYPKETYTITVFIPFEDYFRYLGWINFLEWGIPKPCFPVYNKYHFKDIKLDEHIEINIKNLIDKMLRTSISLPMGQLLDIPFLYYSTIKWITLEIVSEDSMYGYKKGIDSDGINELLIELKEFLNTNYKEMTPPEINEEQKKCTIDTLDKALAKKWCEEHNMYNPEKEDCSKFEYSGCSPLEGKERLRECYFGKEIDNKEEEK